VLRWLPRFLLSTKVPSASDTIYLSFDDGPHPEHTPRVLDLLRRHDAHASFFMVGRAAEAHPAIVRRAVDEGHLIGNHSYSHPRFTLIPLAEQLDEIARADRILAEFDGNARHRFRPPSGALPVSLMLHCWRSRRCIAYWSYDTLDYRREPKDRIVERLRTIPPVEGDVLLMHDDDHRIVEVLEEMLPEWRAAGFKMRTLPEQAA
jgi:peptidoglycan/xylan/chitin deacetylase (PgdA/CDA1 family)